VSVAVCPVLVQMLVLHWLRVVGSNHGNDTASRCDLLALRSSRCDLSHQLWQIHQQRLWNLELIDLLFQLPQVATSVARFDDLHLLFVR